MNNFLSRLKLSQLIIGSLMIIGLVPLLVLAYILITFSESALESSSYNQLNSVRAIKAKQVETYFAEREGDLNVLADIVHSFHDEAVKHLANDSLEKSEAVTTLFSTLKKELKIFSLDKETKKALDAFSSIPLEQGEEISETTRWKIMAQIYGEHVDSFQHIFGWYDAFLISTDGTILYTSAKESDLGKNLNGNALHDSSLTREYHKAKSDKSLDNKSYFGDFAYYEPSKSFASFIITKVIKNKKLIGYVALQLPLDELDKLFHLKKDGDSYSYLVGHDKKLRSDTPFLSIEESHSNNRLIDTKATQEGISGRAGHGIIRNSKNELVLAQWQPIKVSADTQWVFINEILLDHAVVPINESGASFYHQYMKSYGYYDVFLIAPDGDIFYTETKESDYKTNILSGRFSSSNLGKLIRDVKASGHYGIADFAPYEPSQGAPAAFIAEAINDTSSGQPIYYIALQLSLDSINEMMLLREGMGETGETYLVGADYRMRSDSYLDSSSHSVEASFAGNVENNGIKTDASQAALRGESGTQEIIDYNGNPVLSSYSPITVGSTNWAVIAEIDSSEAFKAVASIRKSTLIAVGISLIATILLAIYLSHIIRRPLGGEPKEMMQLAGQIAEGDLTHQFEDNVQSDSIYASLKDMSDNLKGLIEQILESSQVLASTAEETSVACEETTTAVANQQADTEMVATAVNQMTSTVNDVAQNTESAAMLSKETYSKSQEGIAMVNSSVEAINTLIDDIKGTASDMEILVDSTDQIDQVLTVIQTISEQTNLLALNAAIEAARAGESGRGFAVVADEVRQLAQKTQASASDIQTIVSSVQNAAKTSSEKMQRSVQQTQATGELSEKTVGAFEEINTAVGKIDDMMAQISTASEEQAHVSEDINGRVVQINEASIQTSASAQQLSQASQEVARSAESLTEYTQKFKV